MTKKVLFSLSTVIITVILTVFAICNATSCLAGQTNWWDKFGQPQYGDSITISVPDLSGVAYDPYTFPGTNAFQMTNETLLFMDWTLDRNIWSFQGTFYPDQYVKGLLAKSWEHPDPLSYVFHLREGIRWQNIPPANGREFVASDVVDHYNRVLGIGAYTEPQRALAGRLNLVDSVIANDQYTVTFKLKQPGAAGLIQLLDPGNQNYIENPESVKQAGGEIKDWKLMIGTGPWMIKDFVSGSSATYVKNSAYWGCDERNPKNRLPYADTFKLLSIKDIATQISALRTGKLDIIGSYIGGVSWQQAQTLAKSNPELLQAKIPVGGACIQPRVDKAPFTDIRVRQALQLALNLPQIADGYYDGIVDSTPCGVITPMYKGWAYDYQDWPQQLKDEYAYDLKKAKQLLTDAGFPNGFKTNVITGSNEDMQLLQAIKSMFMDIGVDMTINSMDPVAAFKFMLAGKQDQLYYSTVTGVTYPPTVVIANMFNTKAPTNTARNTDPTMDEIVQRALTARNLNDMKQAAYEGDKRYVEQHYRIFTFPINAYYVYQPYFKGYSGEQLQYGIGATFARLWIDQDIKKSAGR